MRETLAGFLGPYDKYIETEILKRKALTHEGQKLFTRYETCRQEFPSWQKTCPTFRYHSKVILTSFESFRQCLGDLRTQVSDRFLSDSEVLEFGREEKRIIETL